MADQGSVDPNAAAHPGASLRDGSVRSLLVGAVVLPFLLLAAIAGVLTWQVRALIAANQRVLHSEEVISAARRAYRLVVDLESGVRGYLLTGHDTFLEPYQEGSGQVTTTLTRLEHLVSDNPIQVARVRSVARDRDRWEIYARTLLVQRASGQAYASFEAQLTGKTIMDSVRTQLQSLIDTEYELLHARANASNRAARMMVFSSLGLTTLLGLGMGLIARDRIGAVVRRYDLALETIQRQATDLLTSEERLRTLLQGVTGHAVFLLGPHGQVMSWNTGAARILGHEADDIMGRPWSLFFPSHHVEVGVPERALARAVEEGQFEEEAWRIRSDGSRFWASVVVSPVRTPTGALRGFSVVIRDMTRQHQADTALVASEERFRLMVESVAEYAIFSVDQAGRVQSWNVGATRLFGYPPDGIVGRPLSRLYPGDEIEAARPERDLQESQERGRLSGEGWRVRADGSRFWANMVVTSLRDEAGVLRGFSVICRDETERRRVEEERRRLYQAAQDSLHARDAFLSIAAHELRTPLTALQLDVDAFERKLARGAGPQELRLPERVSRLRRHTGRLVSLSDLMIDAVKIAAGDLPLHFEQVDAVEVARTVVAHHAEELARAGCAVSIRSQGQVVGTWDQARLSQIIEQLLTNAIKFGAGHPIEVSLSRRQDMARIAVSDQGIGIEPALRDEIFERYGRAVSDRHYGGMGLGLWMVRTLTTAFGGTIAVESEPGRGSRFEIALPLEPGVRAA